MPYNVITDQGTQFRSELFKNIGVICIFKVCTTTSYHPQCNGKIERTHRTLKTAIRVHNSVQWTQTLPTVFLGLRSALRSDTNYTIAQMVYGQTIRLPGQFFEIPKNVLFTDTFVEELQKQMDQLQPLKTRRQPSQKHFARKDLHNSTHVYLRVDKEKKALEPPYDGPFPVAKKYDKYFTVKIKGKDFNIYVDRLKPAYLLLNDGDNPDHFKQLEQAPTLPEKKLIVKRKIEKQPPDLLKKDVHRTITHSSRHVTFLARYRD
ncbi:transposon Tf2-9 polyprotein [Trichonephila clavipes]|nr:transposon Tf2-9 polyprotein [Trichonephila clavipes]